MIGKTLVHYEITAEIGKGGMGEVYQAKDTKLGRDVAIKVLPEEFALDTDRVARFQREAKLLASLNHPNIAAIYGLEESEGTHFLVMELIEGDTLRDRIKSGPIPVEEALKLALQMAEALEAAHEKGVIHRDLKPANIKVTPEGKVKILDFGLAKAYTGDQGNINLADSPTISAAATQQGVILGTAAYMSPEQAKGKPVDKRADIWAFGVVLYEMLTGKSAFQGEDVSETLASVIKGDSNLTLLPVNIHPRVREVITRCLQKEQKKRYGGIGETQYEIEQVLADPSGVFAQHISIQGPRRNTRSTLALIASAVILTAIIVGVAIWFLKPSAPTQVMRFDYELPSGQQLLKPSNVPALAVSPDGKLFVYSTPEGLYLRSVDELNAKLIAGTEGRQMMPFFSPDGKWIGYSADSSQLKKISVNGGAPVTLCDFNGYFGGGSWGADNTIVYAQWSSGDIMSVSGDGGTPEPIIKPLRAIVYPQLLQGGKAVIYTDFSVQPGRIMVHSLESGERKELFPGTRAMYVPTGHLVYGLANNDLFAVPFDPSKLEVTGGPVPLEEDVLEFIVSNSGTLVYVPGTSASTPLRTLVWVDREGNEEQIEAEPNIYSFPKISPNGNQVALSIEDPGNQIQEIFIWDEVRKILNKRTFDKSTDKMVPNWTPDGERIVYFSNHEKSDTGGIYWRPANGTGEAEKLASNPDRRLFPYSFSNDGKILVMHELISASNLDISILSMEDDGERKLLLQTEFYEGQPKISPDNQYIAFVCDESDQKEIYVSPLLDVKKGKWQISQGGGTCPLWSPDGKELFYLGLDNSVMAVDVETKPIFDYGTPKVLFQSKYVGFAFATGTPWDIHPDGKRFLMMKPTVTPDAAVGQQLKIIVVTNWFEELKERVPVN
jgi:serine/threonine protein kinase